MKNLILIILILCAASSLHYSQIILDENLDDWQGVQAVYEDPADPGDQLNADFRRLSVSNDQNNLFLLLELGNEIIFQEYNNIVVYIDTDQSASSGRQYHGIGADLEFSFGQREGIFYYQTSTYSMSQNDIGLKSSPTVSSKVFEIAIDLNAMYGSIEIFPNDTISIVLGHDAAGTDQLPDEPGGVEYKITSDVEYKQNFQLSRNPSSDIRIMSYNVRRDDIFQPGLSGNYERILSAVSPDIVGFQEIYGHTSQETAVLVESIIPSGNGEQWYNAKAGGDIIVVSRYEIKSVFEIDGNGAFLLNLRPHYETDLLLLNAHPPCCQNVDSRTREIDHMMSFVRDAKENGGELTIAENTPIVILGDMNLVSSAETQQILTTGNLVNNNIYGSDFTPDWDETEFEDAMPLTTGVPMTFTWFSPSSSFSPGRLDYIVYSGSVLELENSFVLFTPAMESDSLTKYGLQSRDVVNASDHLPVVADFQLRTQIDVSLQLYPLSVGNKWIYTEKGVWYDTEPHIIDRVFYEEITRDTLLNDGNRYYWIDTGLNWGSRWIRIDSSSGFVYERTSPESDEYLTYDLGAVGNKEFETRDGIVYSVVERDTLMWDLNRYSKTFNLWSLNIYQQTLVEGIGIVKLFTEFDFGNTTIALKGCIINGIVYGDTLLVGTEDSDQALPTSFSLSQNYPNPFNPATTINYSLPTVKRMASFADVQNSEFSQSGDWLYRVTLIVYDMLGREVATLVNEHQRAGNYQVTLGAELLPSGVYFYRLTSGNVSLTRKMLLMK